MICLLHGMVKGNLFIVAIRKQTLRNLKESRAKRERSGLSMSRRVDMARALWPRGEQQAIENRDNTVRWDRGHGKSSRL